MNRETLEDAYRRIKSVVRATPLLRSPLLNQLSQRDIWVKAECLQYGGSFKFRGAFSALSHLSDEQRGRGVIAYSSGNHAQGVALAARHYGVSATIVMPADAPKRKIANTQAYGANVLLYNRATENREAIGQALAEQEQLTLIKPYDDVDVIAGQGSIGIELAAAFAERAIKAPQVLVCCGGGGLTAGIASALHFFYPEASVYPVEPEHFDDTARSLASGRRESNSQLSGSLCDAVLAPTPGELTWPLLQQYCTRGFVVSESAVLDAMKWAFDHLKLVIEPGGAVALAAALTHQELDTTRPIVAIASGGNVDPDVFALALQR